MTYAKHIGIFAVVLLGMYTAFAVDNELTLEEQIAQEIEKQNIAIDKQNDLLTRKYQEQMIQCTSSASGSHTEVLSKLEQCAKMEKPNLQKRVGEIVDTGIINTQYWDNEQEYLKKLHNKICTKQVNSPLCKDYKLLSELYVITEERIPKKNFFPILIGITNAESSLGLNFAKDAIGGTCSGRNNWGGTKYQINDNNTRVHSRSLNGFLYGSQYTNRYTDQYGCNVYPFESVQEYWRTKVNGMRYGYKSCIDSLTPIRCLSGPYVGDPKIQEQSWIDNVSYFIQ